MRWATNIVVWNVHGRCATSRVGVPLGCGTVPVPARCSRGPGVYDLSTVSRGSKSERSETMTRKPRAKRTRWSTIACVVSTAVVLSLAGAERLHADTFQLPKRCVPDSTIGCSTRCVVDTTIQDPDDQCYCDQMGQGGDPYKGECVWERVTTTTTPALSEWGVGILSLLLLTGVTLKFRGRQATGRVL